MHLELLEARRMLDASSWTTFTTQVIGQPEPVAISIPISMSERDTTPERVGERVMHIGGTTGSEKLSFSLTTTFDVTDDIRQYYLFLPFRSPLLGVNDPVINEARTGAENEWRRQLDMEFEIYSTFNLPVVTATYGNTRFYFEMRTTDRIVADVGAGDDVITLDRGIRIKTEIAGGRGNDTLTGGGAYAYLSGGDGRDKLVAQGNSSDLVGGAQADTLIGSVGVDRMSGGGGNDRLLAARPITGGVSARSVSQDVLTGGKGSDRASYDFGATLISIEELAWNQAADNESWGEGFWK